MWNVNLKPYIVYALMARQIDGEKKCNFRSFQKFSLVDVNQDPSGFELLIHGSQALYFNPWAMTLYNHID